MLFIFYGFKWIVNIKHLQKQGYRWIELLLVKFLHSKRNLNRVFVFSTVWICYNNIIFMEARSAKYRLVKKNLWSTFYLTWSLIWKRVFHVLNQVKSLHCDVKISDWIQTIKLDDHNIFLLKSRINLRMKTRELSNFQAILL